MSDNDEWSEAPQPRRKGPPKWMLLTGCGCLIPGFFLIALAAWGMQYFGNATSPRQMYDTLARALPYDEVLLGKATGLADDPGTRELESYSDPEFELVFGAEIPFSGGLAIFYFVRGATVVDGVAKFGDDGVAAMLTKVPSSQSDDILRSHVDGDPGEPFQLDVQGVTLSGMRHATMKSEIIVQFPRGTATITGPGVSLKVLSDVAQDPEDPESKRYDVLLVMQRATPEGPGLTDEDVRAFLAPFRVGPNR